MHKYSHAGIQKSQLDRHLFNLGSSARVVSIKEKIGEVRTLQICYIRYEGGPSPLNTKIIVRLGVESMENLI